MQIPFITDSINMQINLTQYAIWQTNIADSNIAVDTKIYATNNNEVQIYERLEDIYINGIGYSDIISVISIPLIIALFAFSFPFIFQTINHINDKYASKHISKTFKMSIIYIFFKIVNALSIIYILAFGACSLLLKEDMIVRYSQIWNWITISVAFSYASVVMLFVWYCMDFNNPDKLLKIIKRRYDLDTHIVRGQQKWLLCKSMLRTLCHYKDKTGNSIYKSTRNRVYRWRNSIPKDNYVSSLIGVARFAVKENDLVLFNNVFSYLDKIIDAEKKDFDTLAINSRKDDVIKESAVHHRTMWFFDELMTTYRPFNNAYMQDESIVFRLVGAFDKSKYMNYIDNFQLAVCMRKMLDYGNISLLEKYIDYTQRYFGYIKQLPRVFYIKGGLPSKRAIVERKADKSWNNLCNFHYIALTYAFDKCYYSLLKTHLEREGYSNYNLYPKTGADILIRYAHCIKEIWHLQTKIIIGQNVDIKSILSRYTAILLLLVPKEEEYGYPISENITKEIISIIESSKDNLKKEVRIVKNNKQLLVLYPFLANEDFENRFNYFFEIIKSINNPNENNGEKENTIHGLFKKLTGHLLGVNISIKNEHPKINLYTQKLNKKLTNDFSFLFKHSMADVKQFIPNNLFTSDLDNKNVDINVNPCQMLISKQCFLDIGGDYDNYMDLYNEYIEQISTRLIYLALASFRKMTSKEVFVKSSDFDVFFEKFTKGKRDNYILIGVDSPLESILNIRFQGRDRFYNNSIPFVSIDSSTKSLLTDLDDYNYFKYSLLIVTKKDLPVIADIEEKENISVDYNDISDESTLQLNVRVTVDTHKKVVFNSNAKIAMVRLKRIPL